FSYGSEAPIDGRASCFQAGLFRLPVRTGALAGWPMASGAAVVFLLWLAIPWFILRPSLRLQDDVVPLWWPAARAVATLAPAPARRPVAAAPATVRFRRAGPGLVRVAPHRQFPAHHDRLAAAGHVAVSRFRPQ